MGASPEAKVEGRIEVGPATAGGSQVRRQRALPPTWRLAARGVQGRFWSLPRGSLKTKNMTHSYSFYLILL